MRFAANYVTGSHALKIGMADMWGTRNYQYDTNQAQAWTFLRGIPTTITEYARPLIDTEHLNAALGLYAQDRWTVEPADTQPRSALRLPQRACAGADARGDSVRRGAPVRADRRRAELEGYLAAHRRDLRPVRRTARPCVRGAYDKYVASESTNMATLNNRVNTSINSASRTWTDTNGNFVPDCNLRIPPLNGECGALNAPLGVAERRCAVRPVDHQRLRASVRTTPNSRPASSTS